MTQHVGYFWDLARAEEYRNKADHLDISKRKKIVAYFKLRSQEIWQYCYLLFFNFLKKYRTLKK